MYLDTLGISYLHIFKRIPFSLPPFIFGSKHTIWLLCFSFLSCVLENPGHGWVVLEERWSPGLYPERPSQGYILPGSTFSWWELPVVYFLTLSGNTASEIKKPIVHLERSTKFYIGKNESIPNWIDGECVLRLLDGFEYELYTPSNCGK